MLYVLNHPLITHKLTQMRKTETKTKDFRQNLDEIAGLMAYEICRDLPVRKVTIQTPICECVTEELSREIVLIPILRAGLGLVNGIADLIPTAKVGFIGLYRDEQTLQPHEYFAKFPGAGSDAGDRRFCCGGHRHDQKAGSENDQAGVSGRRSGRRQRCGSGASGRGYLSGGAG